MKIVGAVMVFLAVAFAVSILVAGVKAAWDTWRGDPW